MASARVTINTRDLEDGLRKILGRIDAMRDMQRDVQFKAQIKAIAARIWSDVWATRGAYIGSDWSGRDLVITGALRDSLASVARLNMTVTGNQITLGTDVNYARYVNDSFNFMRIGGALEGPVLNEVSDFWQRTRSGTTRRQ